MSLAGDLKKESKDFKLSVLVRTYDGNDKGQRRYQEEAGILGQHGYVPQTSTQDGGHVHAGRILLTGGLSIFAGRRGIRSKGRLNVTFVKTAPTPATSAAPTYTPPPEQPPTQVAPDGSERIRRLAQLRDSGVIMQAEFDAKRAEIMPSDPAEHLQRWSELRDKGTITPEYFEQKKAEILSQL